MAPASAAGFFGDDARLDRGAGPGHRHRRSAGDGEGLGFARAAGTGPFHDDGPGIPEDEQSRIFDPFFTTKPVGVGTGLGLSLSHGIIERHGGRISVASQPGRGTTFIIELPLDATPAE